MLKIVLYYLIAINLFTFLIFGIDKRKAQKNQWRIPESTLIGLAIFGGSIGAILGMRLFHHKTLHKKFYIGIPAILLLQIAACVFVLFRLKMF